MHENRETSETPAVKPGSRSAGEGDSRTARAHVSEESHCGIVPMNYSNKDKTSSAESGEGGLRLKENTAHSTRTRHSAGLGVSHGGARGRTSILFGRFSSERRTGCAFMTFSSHLTSARPGLCGGHRVTGVPTAITN